MHVTVWPAVAQDQSVPVAVPGVMPPGKTSVNCGATASAPPPEDTVATAVYVTVPPCRKAPPEPSARLTPRTGDTETAPTVPASVADATCESSETSCPTSSTVPVAPADTAAGRVIGGSAVPEAIG